MHSSQLAANYKLHAVGIATTPAAPGFGALLRQYRTQAGLSQLKLALLCDVDASYLSKLESGTKRPAHDAVLRIAAVLALSLADSRHLEATAGFWPESLPLDVLAGLVDKEA